MRTTLAIEDTLLHQVRVYAGAKGISLSRAMNEVLERGLRPQIPRVVVKHGFPVLVPATAAPQVTTEQIKRLQDEDV